MTIQERVELDTASAQKALKGLTNAWQESTKAAKDSGQAQAKAAKGGDELTKSLEGVGKALGTMNMVLGAGGLVAAIGGLVAGLDAAVQSGISASAVFGNQAISIDKARAATRGLVDDLSLQIAANKAVSLGAVKTEEDFAKLAEAATKLGLATGQGAAKSVDDLTTAIARQSAPILDNLGITLKMEDAHRIYAASIGKTVDALTAEEKAQAFKTVALQKALEASEKVHLELDAGLIKWEQMKRQLETLGHDTLPLVAGAAGHLATQLQPVVSYLTEMTTAAGGLRGELSKMNDVMEEGSPLWREAQAMWQSLPPMINPVNFVLSTQAKMLEESRKNTEAWMASEDQVEKSSPRFVSAIDQRIAAVQEFVGELKDAQAMQAGLAGRSAVQDLGRKAQGLYGKAKEGALSATRSQTAHQFYRAWETLRDGVTEEQEKRSKQKGGTAKDDGVDSFKEHFDAQTRNAREVSLQTADPDAQADAYVRALERQMEADEERTEFTRELTDARLEHMDREIERQEALGQETTFLFERRMELALEAADQEQDHDQVAQLIHEREMGRIARQKAAEEKAREAAEKSAKDQAKFRKDLANVTIATVGSVAQITEAAATSAGLSADKVAKATTIARGVETLARAAFEQVEAIACFARYDIPGGILHEIAAVTGFALGGMMLAGQVPTGGASAGGSGSGGGRYSGPQRETQDRPDFPTSPQEQAGQQQSSGRQQSGGTTIIVQGSVIDAAGLFEVMQQANETGPRRTGTF